MVICLERGADLHMAQLMPLPLTVSCFSKIQIGFTFLVPAYPGSPGKRAVKRVNGRVCNSQLSVAGIKLGCWRMVDRLKAWSRSESQVEPSAVPGRGTSRLQAGGRSLLLGCRLRRHLAARDRTAHPSHTGNRHARSHARRHTQHARAHCATTQPRFARTIYALFIGRRTGGPKRTLDASGHC